MPRCLFLTALCLVFYDVFCLFMVLCSQGKELNAGGKKLLVKNRVKPNLLKIGRASCRERVSSPV